MEAKDIEKLVRKAKDDIVKEVNDRLPRKVGVVAVNHFKQNFRDGGWLDNGLHTWKRTRRQDGNSLIPNTGRSHPGATTSCAPSRSTTGPGTVTVENPVPYAAIHNDGGEITTHPTITERMRKYAWHMVYSLAGVKGKGKLPKELPTEADKWKGLALTKKKNITVHAKIPQRRFMGDSAELRTKVNRIIKDSIQRIKDGIIALSSH